MKFLCTLKNTLIIIRNHFVQCFDSKGLGYLAALMLLLLLLARYKLPCYQTTPLLIILALADITLLKTTCHFLLLLIGFDTLIERTTIDPLYLWVIRVALDALTISPFLVIDDKLVEVFNGDKVCEIVKDRVLSS